MQQGDPSQYSDNSENSENGSKSKRRGWITAGLAVLYVVEMIGFSSAFFWSRDKD